jgi:RNA polymerase sigma-70 factor (ECF subfamily)
MHAFVPSFEDSVLPHLDAAYNLARWLTRNDRDAEDVVQEAYLRAFKYFGNFKGGDARPWLLAIVRNSYHNWIKHNRIPEIETTFEEEVYPHRLDTVDPEFLLLREHERQIVRRALRKLPTEFMEVIVLREFEELSYREIADVAQIPVGTVMSRLARARRRLAELVSNCGSTATPEEILV